MNRAALTTGDLKALADVSKEIGVKPDWLYNVISHETAGTWDPKIAASTSSAKGLIQFLDATAKALGYTNSQDLVNKNPTIEGQLRGPVLKYLKAFAPFTNEQSLYLAVFLPAYRHAPADTVIYGKPGEEGKRAAFVKANPAINKVSDYIGRVKAAGQGVLFQVDGQKAKNVLIPAAVIFTVLLFLIKTLAQRGNNATEQPTETATV